ncbi:MAG TPA: type II toxin-antitoxin system RelE/ParE family toxin [bacterium]|nr:type II toxin-antitoxin system RelE/ParE family toxin [bacterium]HPO08276.1 type II toxin-antitoxin system RelE/ParE family toxin [bacterium]HQO35645.1 type II toxin-antitoxin system RelE/ParE family toxin [bacterium]HQP99573.1 type II toxin-antitoxin system RelE/ParE family toxin [bacterium]
MAEIRWTEEALRRLQDIYNYIAEDNPVIAHKVIKEIYDRAQILHRFPQIGHTYRCESDGEIRILLYGHYRIAYLLKPTGAVDILGVFHGSLDIDRYLP